MRAESCCLQLKTALCAAVLAASITASHAGTCLPEIDRAQADVDAKLEAKAGAADPDTESAAAKLHHQPSPHSLAITESRLGLLSPDDVRMLEAGMARAREADSVGDTDACKQALTELNRIIHSK